MDYVKAFVVGGIICAIVQILMEKTKLMPGRIMVMLSRIGFIKLSVFASYTLAFDILSPLFWLYGCNYSQLLWIAAWCL